jgi:hypothetical protein
VNGQGRGLDRVLVRPLGTAALEVTPDRQASSRRAVPCAVLGREAVVLSWCSVQRGQSGSSASTRLTFEIAMR